MKTVRLLIATTLALAALGGLVVALEWTQPTAASVEDAPSAPAAPQTLPPPWLSDDDVVDAPYNWWWPTVDGFIAPGEYAGAGKVTFPGYSGDVEVFFKQDGSNLYVAFDFPALGSSVSGDNYADVYLDTDNDGGGLDGNDYWLRVCDDGTTQEYTATTGSWTQVTTPVSWTAAAMTSLTGGIWQAEFAIEYSKLGLIAGTFKELGLAIGATDGGMYLWPAGANGSTPGTWGSLVSSSGSTTVPSGWDSFYWKPGPWEDYAPSGMPDFDQSQNNWFLPGGPMGEVRTHDGPAAAANSLWWFDSKFETPDHPPPAISDTYRLVQSYDPAGLWDDHHYSNTVPLIDDLATRYFGTNQGISGTDPISMFLGIHQYLRDHGLWDDYIVTLVEQPSFDWVADEVMRSEDVILLLGFYEWRELEGRWARVGGHYVNVAGVDPAGFIALSDPLVDYAENGWAGRVLSGTLIPHTPIPGHDSTIHNDAGNISHDVYTVTESTSPGGVWGLERYGYWNWGGGIWGWNEIFGFLFGINPNPLIDMEPYTWGEIQTEVEFALTVSPYTWKASGEWYEEEVEGWWECFEDYAPNGIPDFDQKQDDWRNPPDPTGKWTFCGPVAAANSLWWFDSKFEPTPLGPPVPPPYGAIPYNDNYPLVQSYDPAGLWDDHDPLNVDDPATPWPGPGVFPPPVQPGQGEFVEDLAVWFQTDMPPGIGSGTIVTNLRDGIDNYLQYHNLRQGYVITQVKSPDFWWVAEEVEVSEDVILLMGFWQHQYEGTPDEQWVRLGGHYVTLPGVDKQGGFVAFSDPWFDRIGQTWPYAGGLWPGWPSYMGRVADGWLIPHQHPPSPPDTTHNDAGNVSHDVYNVIGTDSPGGVWGPEEYVDGWGSIENFWGQNGQEEITEVTPDPIQAEVEWAVAVSPVADVWITKTVVPTVVVPGGWVTFTITFSNGGSLPAENVVITDLLPSELVNATWNYWASNGFVVSARPSITYVWNLPDLAWREWGVITVTAQVSPTASGVITNIAEIATSSVEQYQISQYANTAQATFTVKCVKVTGVTLVVTNTGDIYTDTVVHFNADIAPDDADKPYNYRLTTDGTPGGVMTSIADPLLFTDTFATTGTHTVEIAVWNCSMSASQAVTDSVVVTVSEKPAICVEVTDVDLTLLTGGDIYTDTNVQFSANVTPDNADKPYTYTVDYGDGVSVTTTSSADPLTTPLDHTFATTGVFTVEIAVWNCSMSASQAVTDTVVVTVSEKPAICVEVTDVDLTLLTGGDIYTDTNVQFSADITPDNADKPYTYTVDYGDGVSVTTTSSADPLTLNHTFATTGVFTVEIAVWNCSMSASQAVTDTVDVTVSEKPAICVEVTDVDLTLLTGGDIYTDTNVQFSADITPDNADKPYTYTIDYGDGVSMTTTSSADPLALNHTFATTGVFTVEIAVWNCSMSASQAVTDSVDVTVSECVPPAGASFIYAPLNPLTGQTVVFTGSVALGDPPPTYTWDFDDGTGSGNPATHIYNSAGTYTAWMTATNSCGQAVYSDTVSVCEPAGNASVQYAPAEPWVNQTVFFTATATGSGLIAYDWAADDGWMTSGITATHAFTALGNHTVWMTATNGCGQDYASEVILVRGYGVDLQPPSGSATGKPGGWITYTLTILNVGNMTDTYNITGSVTGEAWPTNWPAAVGPVAGGGNAQLDVTVQISSTANDGDWSQVVITAISQGDGSKKATSVLTTTVTTQPVVRDVKIAPHTAAQTGDVGTTVTYTLRITNTGTISDYFNLSVSGPAWGTVLSVYGLDLKPGEGQPVTVYVQIPAGAASGAQDAATVTARSAVAPAVADSAVLTTTAYVPNYGVELTPLVAQQAGHPGDVMTYTLTVRNTGERDDTYTLSKGLHTWPTTLSVSSVGPLAPNGIAQFSVTVQIPGSVSSGTFDTVQVTATSQKDGSESDTAVLTTTAIASTQPITRGVALTATVAAREGIVGDWITYTLRVTNTGNVADFFNLTWQGNTWPVDLSAYGLSLGAGQGADVLAYVQPPLTASDGATDTVTIKATSANDATATDGVALTTTARWRHVYLPLVLRNHQ